MTPAIRHLENAKIAFTVHRFEHDPEAEAFGMEAAAKLRVSPESVYKTLVARGDDARTLVLAIIPAPARLDLKKLAGLLGAKKADLADPQVAQRATGYILGGISPLATKKKLATYVSDSVQTLASVLVSAGQRGMQVELTPDDLLRLTDATLADLT